MILPANIELDLFAVIWNQTQNQKPPNVHLKILRWLNKSWLNGDRHLLLMAFRSCGKSTLVGIFCAWILYLNPNIRIMVVAAEETLAKKMVRNVKRMIERHPLMLHLRPQSVDQWGSDRFTIQRDLELRDPSMIARGLTSNLTGSRADIIIYDDVEVPNTSSTAEARESLRDILNESRFILTPQGTQLYVGTPHCYDTIYATENDTNKTDVIEAFLDGFQSLRVPILDDNGQSVWPQRFDIANIQSMARQVGPNKFASQMMLQPVNIAQGRLNPDLLSYYHDNLDYKEVMQKPSLYLNGVQMVSCSSWWDPAFGSAKGDASVWALVFTDAQGLYYLHHIEYIRVNSLDNDDEATQQCKKIAALLKRFYVSNIYVEINGIGRFLPAILRREIRLSGHRASVIEQSSRTPKVQRILESFDAVMAAKSLYVHSAVKNTPFLNEMREWRPTLNQGHDDGLDAVAGAISQEAIRIAAGTQKTSFKTWYPNAKIFKAKT